MAILDKVQDKMQEFKNQNVHEGQMTKQIERQTAKMPSIGYLGLALGSMALSGILAVTAERKELANFVGLWAPSFLLIGIYNKLVKLEEQYGKQGIGGQSQAA